MGYSHIAHRKSTSTAEFDSSIRSPVPYWPMVMLTTIIPLADVADLATRSVTSYENLMRRSFLRSGSIFLQLSKFYMLMVDNYVQYAALPKDKN